MKRLPLIFLWLIVASLILVLLLLNQTKNSLAQGLDPVVALEDHNEQPGIGDALKNFIETKFNIHRKLPLFPPEDQIKRGFCSSSMKFEARPYNPQVPILYVITPTYTRREQVIEMTRLSHTLLHVDNVIWVIGEDSDTCSNLVRDLLQKFKMPYAHLTSPMPKMYLSEKYKPRGVASRRAGMEWVLKNHDKSKVGIIYFADDDNTYDLKLFEEIRRTKRVSVFPVGFVGSKGSPGITSPIVKDGKVVGFSDDWFASRVFPVDMAGFAVNVNFLSHRPNASMPFWAGYEEDVFLQSLDVRLIDLEPLANDCSEVLVWHTKTVSDKAPKVKLTKNLDTNLKSLVTDLIYKGMNVLDKKSKNELKACLKGEKCGKYSNL